MEVPHDAVLLRIFTSVADRWKMGPLYLGIVEKWPWRLTYTWLARQCLRGLLGFGQSGKLHRGHLLPSTQDLPVVIEIVDSEAKINTFLPVLDEMMESGLVTIEKALVLHYGRQRATLLSRLKAPVSTRNKATAGSLALGLASAQALSSCVASR